MAECDGDRRRILVVADATGDGVSSRVWTWCIADALRGRGLPVEVVRTRDVWGSPEALAQRAAAVVWPELSHNDRRVGELEHSRGESGLAEYVENGGAVVFVNDSYCNGQPVGAGLLGDRVPWQVSAYYRTEHVRSPAANGRVHPSRKRFGPKATLLSKESVPESDKVFAAPGGSGSYSLVPGFGGRDCGGLTAVAARQVGRGSVAYVGDVNCEYETIDIIADLACSGAGWPLCGSVWKPTTLDPRNHVDWEEMERRIDSELGFDAKEMACNGPGCLQQGTMKCALCTIRYCSAACQRAHWKGAKGQVPHEMECSQVCSARNCDDFVRSTPGVSYEVCSSCAPLGVLWCSSTCRKADAANHRCKCWEFDHPTASIDGCSVRYLRTSDVLQSETSKGEWHEVPEAEAGDAVGTWLAGCRAERRAKMKAAKKCRKAQRDEWQQLKKRCAKLG